MRGDLLDVVLVVASLLFAVSGYRQGFVVGVLSFLGFLGGGLLGARYAPVLARTAALDALPRPLVGLGVLVAAAMLGQLLATGVGRALRNRVLWRPLRVADALAGAAISVAGLLLVSWLVGIAVAASPFPALSGQVRRSQVLDVVDGVVPAGARTMLAGLRRVVDEHGFPEVFGDLVPTRVRPVEAPDPRVAGSRAVQVAGSRVVKVTGVAAACSRRIEGSGFVYAPGRVMTNAHVVAGVARPVVRTAAGTLPASVVLFDPERDVAVLSVPGLVLPPLEFAGQARTGASAVVVGYPEDGPLRADPARVRGVQLVRGPDIYSQHRVLREIYPLRTRVRPGNSGGPLLDGRGRVYGVVFAAAADDPQTGFALTAREVRADAARGRTATRPVSTRSCE